MPLFRIQEENMIALKVLTEGLLLGFFLYVICALGIRNGAIGMIHLYGKDVQNRAVELGLTTHEKIRKRNILFKIFCLAGYIIYVLCAVYVVNRARGFLQEFIQPFIILMIMNVIDRLLIDEYWVNHTGAWDIPGTEDLKPYIKSDEKKKKWIYETIGFALVSVILAAFMALILN